MDLTSLNDDDTDERIEALCQRAKTPAGHPAAICIYPRFIVPARRALTAHRLNDTIHIATVTNFPHGDATSCVPLARPAKPLLPAPMKSMWSSPTVR